MEWRTISIVSALNIGGRSHSRVNTTMLNSKWALSTNKHLIGWLHHHIAWDWSPSASRGWSEPALAQTPKVKMIIVISMMQPHNWQKDCCTLTLRYLHDKKGFTPYASSNALLNWSDCRHNVRTAHNSLAVCQMMWKQWQDIHYYAPYNNDMLYTL